MNRQTHDSGTHRPMRVGLNLLYLLPGIVGGTETYAAGLMHGLVEVDDHLEYTIFLNQESRDWPLPGSPNIRRVVCPVRAASRTRRMLFEQFRLPGLAREHGLDVLHSLGYVAPLISGCPGVVTIHDMNTKGHRQSMPWLKRQLLALLVRGSAHAARLVITVSEFSRQEIHRHLGLPLERIHVVHEAPLLPGSSKINTFLKLQEDAEGQQPATPADPRPAQPDMPYVLAFASQSPHKNIPRLIEAFARIAPSIPHCLVLAGHLPQDGTVGRAIQRWNLDDRVRLTGYLPRNEVVQLMKQAALFAFPSLYEGFGLPLLEAQALDIPVACADRGALPEVAGEGAVFFDPENILDMAATLASALSDQELRLRLVTKGRANQERFSWTKAARKTLELYASAVWRGQNRYLGTNPAIARPGETSPSKTPATHQSP